jgi:Rad3-related DNA helicase
MKSIFRTNEQELFSKLVEKHLADPDAPLLLEGGTGLGKTRAYLAPLFEAAIQNKKIAIILPTHQLIDQLLISSDLAVCRDDKVTVKTFRPKLFFDNSEDYQQQKAEALEADILICTSMSVIIDQRLAGGYNGVTTRDYLLFDEADQLPDTAALAKDMQIPAIVFRDYAIKVKPSEAKSAITSLLTKQNLDAEHRGIAKLMLEAIDDPKWYRQVGINDDGGVEMSHKLAGRLLKTIANRPTSAFISATLSIADRMDDFKRVMGIDKTSRHSEIIEPKSFGRLEFEIDEQEVNSEEWQQAVLAGIQSAAKPCLIVTTSHQTAKLLGHLYPAAVVRDEEETTTEAAQRFAADDGKDALIAAAAWAGLDTPVVWKSVVVPRIPYPQPTVLDGEMISHYVASRNLAVRRMRQVIGRGMRSPDAECQVLIFDKRWKQVEAFVPKRFSEGWQKAISEGARGEHTLSKIERSSAYRKMAFTEYGKTCRACDFVPKADRQLEVHHLYPLYEGQRNTELKDLTVLCRNCHGLAHSEKPPLTIEAMRAINGEEIVEGVDI